MACVIGKKKGKLALKDYQAGKSVSTSYSLLMETEPTLETELDTKINGAGVYLHLHPPTSSFSGQKPATPVLRPPCCEPRATTCSDEGFTTVFNLYDFIGMLVSGIMLPQNLVNLRNGCILLMIGMALAGECLTLVCVHIAFMYVARCAYI